MGQQGAAAIGRTEMNRATQPVKGRGTVLTAVAIAVGVIGAVILSPLASAASNPVATGATTTITLNSGFSNKLKKSGVKLTGLSPAAVKGKTVTLPVEEGSVEPSGAGSLTHEGGLKFKAGKKSVTIKGLVLDTTANSLSGKLGGKSMKIRNSTRSSASPARRRRARRSRRSRPSRATRSSASRPPRPSRRRWAFWLRTTPNSKATWKR